MKVHFRATRIHLKRLFQRRRPWILSRPGRRHRVHDAVGLEPRGRGLLRLFGRVTRSDVMDFEVFLGLRWPCETFIHLQTALCFEFTMSSLSIFSTHFGFPRVWREFRLAAKVASRLQAIKLAGGLDLPTFGPFWRSCRRFEAVSRPPLVISRQFRLPSDVPRSTSPRASASWTPGSLASS